MNGGAEQGTSNGKHIQVFFMINDIEKRKMLNLSFLKYFLTIALHWERLEYR